MSEKIKLNEIKESYSVNRPTKDALGNRVYEEKSFIRYKDVPTVAGWARFGHYALDIVFYYIFAFILAIPIVVILMAFGVDVSNMGDGNITYNILDRLISWLILYPGYYVLFESTMQTTPGKLILGRIVVNEYGEKPTFKQTLIRSYGRVVPFEHFSCLSDYGWHDTWSNTFVIRKKDLEELNLARKTQEFGN